MFPASPFSTPPRPNNPLRQSTASFTPTSSRTNFYSDIAPRANSSIQRASTSGQRRSQPVAGDGITQQRAANASRAAYLNIQRFGSSRPF